MNVNADPNLQNVKVMIVDDHELVRDGIVARLQLSQNITICAQGSDGKEACLLAKEHRPDIIFLDISMPEMNGLEAASQILADCPTAKILFLSIYDNPEYVREAIKIGAKGFLLKDVSADEMLTALFAVHKGGTYLGSKISYALAANGGGICDNKYKLTQREKEVLQAIAKGKTNKEIADAMAISVRTVESHRMSIREKTGGGNAASLSKIAQELNLL